MGWKMLHIPQKENWLKRKLFLLLIGTRFFDRNRSLLDAEVGFNKNVANPLAPLLNGCKRSKAFRKKLLPLSNNDKP